MNPHDIKALLGKKGVRQSQLARSLRVTPTMVNAVIFRKTKSRRVAGAIARVTGRQIADLWPELYGPQSNRHGR